MEDCVRKEMKIQENKEKRKEKQEQKEYEIKILNLRAKELGAKLENKKEKGDIQVLTWNGKSIGRYTGPGLLGPTIDKFRSNRFELEQINRLLEKAVPVKSLNLYKGLSNWCPCGAIDLSAKYFISHCLDHHRGIAMKNSQLNRPPWMDWVEYEDDEIMEMLCFSDNNLDKLINNN